MIYIRINKCASTSISTLVQDVCVILQVNKTSQRVNRSSGWLDRERLKTQDCFTVVRNPFDRAVSQWQHCIRLGNNYTFEQWLEKDFTEMEAEERAHSIRQVDYLLDITGSIDWVDYIFHLEDSELEEKLKEITGAIGSLKHRAKGKYVKKNYYTAYAKELVKAKYYLDFELLGYDRKTLDKFHSYTVL